MQFEEIISKGLKRAYHVSLSVETLLSEVETQLREYSKTARINGFRPGKVPVTHLKKLYGREVLGERLEKMINEANAKLFDESNYRLAQAPEVEFQGDLSNLLSQPSQADQVTYKLQFEILPDITLGSFEDIVVEREEVTFSEEEIQKTLHEMAQSVQDFVSREAEEAAQKGDRVTFDSEARMGGDLFQEGTLQDMRVVLGSGHLIPGFEDQLEGVKAGDEKRVTATFPQDYHAEHLAGKEAEFICKIKKIESPIPYELNDEIAKKWGAENVEEMRELAISHLSRQFQEFLQFKFSKILMDALDERYQFEIPSSLVEQELKEMRRLVTSPPAEQEEVEASNQEGDPLFKDIAARRVRLGLLMRAIAEAEKIEVTEEDLKEEIGRHVRKDPEHARQIWSYYVKNPSAVEAIRSRILEKKAMDFVASKAQVITKPITTEEFEILRNTFFGEEEEEPSQERIEEGPKA